MRLTGMRLAWRLTGACTTGGPAMKVKTYVGATWTVIGFPSGPIVW
jgi:hypothetical protein